VLEVLVGGEEDIEARRREGEQAADPVLDPRKSS
jgi:hypothetical protein